MTLLSNIDILKLREIGAIVIDPFEEKALNNSSLDLTLGNWVSRYTSNGEHVDLGKDEPAAMFRLEEAQFFAGYTGRGFFLAPGERVLGHTREIAGGTVVPCPTCRGSRQVTAIPTRNVLPCLDCLATGSIAVTTQLHATSTAARIGLSACLCAGFGDISFTDIWTLEITNHSPRGLWLPVGSIICQVSFFRVTPPIVGTEYTKTGQYAQQNADSQETHRTWRPERMLPKRLKVRP